MAVRRAGASIASRACALVLAGAVGGAIVVAMLPAVRAAEDPPASGASVASASPAVTSLPDAPPTIASARALPAGSVATLRGVALTGSEFHDGGGYVADETGGIAVIVDGGGFGAGDVVEATGVIGDRFAQRTLRVEAADLATASGSAAAEAETVPLLAVGEAKESRLVHVRATIDGPPTELSAGLAFDVRDATAAARVIVWSATAIDVSSWVPAAQVTMLAVVGQRDSSGTGAAGYRLQPRSPDDVELVVPPPAASPTPTPTDPAPSLTPTPAASPEPTDAPVSIGSARDAPHGSGVTVEGSVTMPPGIVAADTAVIQDATAAIVLRGDLPASLRLGDVVRVSGARSTKAGMETIRVGEVQRLGHSAPVDPTPEGSGSVGEAHEATLVRVSGTLPESARRAASGTISFAADDGTGELRIVIPGSLRAEDEALRAGARVEVTGVVGQETTGADPTRGYRIWPRSASEVHVVRAPDEEPEDLVAPAGGGGNGGRGSGRQPEAAEGVRGGLDDLNGPALADIRIGATLVSGAWPELNLGGVLWDGERVVGVAAESGDLAAAVRGVPAAIEVIGLRSAGSHEVGIALVVVDPGALSAGSHPAAPALTAFPDSGVAWVTAIGDLSTGDGPRRMDTPDGPVTVVVRCDDPAVRVARRASFTGIAVAESRTLIVPCSGVRPVPALSRPAARPSGLPPTASHEPAGEDAAALDSSPSDARSLVAAALLALAGVPVLAAAAALRRHSGPRQPEDPAAGRPDGAGLHIVPLRREGGS